jgi:hypothetical protein
MKKIQINEVPVELNGLPCFQHNGGKLWRLPFEMEEQISLDVWELSKQPSGGRLRFCTDTTQLGLTLDYGRIEQMKNMCRIGHMGVDAYVDGRFWNCICPEQEGKMEGMFFKNAEKQLKQITIYLPLYHDIEIKNIILDDDAKIMSPSPFRLREPVVFYGTSITQGGCASRAGLSYQAILCRELNLDFINLGFSGSGKGEAVMAGEIAKIDAACYILDYGQNNETISEFERVYYPFICEIRKIKPDVPILMTTPIFYTWENWDSEFSELQKRKREIVRDAYQKCINSGDRNVYLAEWNRLMSLTDGEGQVDGCHPNDIGFQRMAEGIRSTIKKILNIL